MGKKVKFSLVVPTLGRTEELNSFLFSLKEQTYNNFEIILVDQNDDNRVENIVENLKDNADRNRLIYIKELKRGISRARNAGLQKVTGDIVAFPDDDCEYPGDLLFNVQRKFAQHKNADMISGICRDKKTGEPSCLRWPPKNLKIKKSNILRSFVSCSIFIKSKALQKELFDEDLGVGSTFGAAEETDYVYRLISRGLKGYYFPEIFVYHPEKEIYGGELTTEYLERIAQYNKGFGAFFRKNLKRSINVSLIFNGIMVILIKPLAGIIISLFNKRNRKLFFLKLKSRSLGFLSYRSTRG